MIRPKEGLCKAGRVFSRGMRMVGGTEIGRGSTPGKGNTLNFSTITKPGWEHPRLISLN